MTTAGALQPTAPLGAVATRALGASTDRRDAPLTATEARLTELVHDAVNRSGLDPHGYSSDAPIRIARSVADFGRPVDVPNAQAMGSPGTGMHIAVNPDMLIPGAKIDELPLLGTTKASYVVVVATHEAGHVNAAYRAPALSDALQGAEMVRRTTGAAHITEAQRDAAALQEHLADMHALLGTGAMPDRDAFFTRQGIDLPKDVRQYAHVLDQLDPEQHGYALAAPMNRAGRLALGQFGHDDAAALWRGGIDRLGEDTRLASFARAVTETAQVDFADRPEVAGTVGRLWDMVGLDGAARAAAPLRDSAAGRGFPAWGSGLPSGLEELLGGLRNLHG